MEVTESASLLLVVNYSYNDKTEQERTTVGQPFIALLKSIIGEVEWKGEGSEKMIVMKKTT